MKPKKCFLPVSGFLTIAPNRRILSVTLISTSMRNSRFIPNSTTLGKLSHLMFLRIKGFMTVTQGLMVEADRSTLRITPVLPFVTIRLMMRVLCFLASVAF